MDQKVFIVTFYLNISKKPAMAIVMKMFLKYMEEHHYPLPVLQTLPIFMECGSNVNVKY